jgi:hypothetical protein
MFTGEVLHGVGHKTIGEVAPAFSYLDDLVTKMVGWSPDARPASIDVVKQELISRHKDFISRQKISELENTVISTSEVDDPLILDPVKVTGVDWDNGRLTVTLNHIVSTPWVEAFRNIGSFSYQFGSEPHSWSFQRNTASVSAAAHAVQQILDNFKEYIDTTNRDYANKQIRDAREQELKMRRELQERLANERKRIAEREQVLAKLKL